VLKARIAAALRYYFTMARKLGKKPKCCTEAAYGEGPRQTNVADRDLDLSPEPLRGGNDRLQFDSTSAAISRSQWHSTTFFVAQGGKTGTTARVLLGRLKLNAVARAISLGPAKIRRLLRPAVEVDGLET
jgi:hypothetical protein